MSLNRVRVSVWAAVLLCAAGATGAFGQAVVYVDDDAPAGGDGTTWATAFRYLQDGLHAAAAGCEIRVAGGVYRPDQDEGGQVTPGDREATFHLADDYTVVGGHAGLADPEAPDVRDVVLHVSVLSGDLAENDVQLDWPETLLSEPTREENSYHVLTASGAWAELHGVFVTGGQANGPTYVGGGALWNTYGRVSLVDCMFVGNAAYPEGGAIFNDGGELTLAGCVLSGNRTFNGGGINTEHGTVTVRACTFERNYAESLGGGLFTSHGSITVLASRFLRNYASHGGAIANTHAPTAIVSNCLIIRNMAEEGSALRTEYSTTDVSNTILWHNVPIGVQFAHGYSGITNVSYSCVEDGRDGVGNIDTNPMLVGDRAHLRPDSPCIDAGDPNGDYAGQVDVDGEPLVSGAGPDMGVDEWVDEDSDALPDWWELRHFGSTTAGLATGDVDDDSVPHAEEYRLGASPFIPQLTIYAAPSGNDAWDGLAPVWDGQHGPKATIQAAIDEASPHEHDEIVLANGIYTGIGNFDLNTKGKRLVVRSAGGPNSCVIDCMGLGQAFRFSEDEDSSTRLEGLTITGGLAEQGGAIHCMTADPVLDSCVIAGNKALDDGGALYMEFSAATLANCVFTRNMADGSGGAMCTWFASPRLTNSLLVGNRAAHAGGAAFYGSDVALTGTTVSRNASQRPSGIWSYDGFIRFERSIVWDNLLPEYQYDGNRSRVSVGHSCIAHTTLGPDNFFEDPMLTRDGLHLRSGSPCIDAVPPSGNYDSQVDLDGEPRLVGAALDIGADEWADIDDDDLPDFWETRFFGSPTAGQPDVDHDIDDLANRSEYATNRNPFRPPYVLHVDPAGEDAWDGRAASWDGVHGPKRTIQAAIDIASDYEQDEVRLGSGVYWGAGNIELNTKGKWLTLRSADGPDNCVIDCEGQGRAMQFEWGETNATVVEGITMRNGHADNGAGVHCMSSAPVIRDCVFQDHVADELGGAMFCDRGANLVAQDCRFTGNTAGLQGGGVFAQRVSNVQLFRCLLSGNSASSGGGVAIVDARPEFVSCALQDNTADAEGGGIYVSSGYAYLDHCQFLANSAAVSGGALMARWSGASLRDCLLGGNSALDHGGALSAYNGWGLHAFRCTFAGNHAPLQPSIHWHGDSSSEVWDSILADGVDAMAFYHYYDPPRIEYCNIIGGCDDWWCSATCINEDPMFVAPSHWDDAGTPDVPEDDTWFEGDLRLLPGSPCVNAGDPEFVASPGAIDLDGHARVLCGRLDMGAYESGIGDADCNGDVDLADFAGLQRCFTGPDALWIGEACEAVDIDFDGDVDGEDYAAWREMAGS